MALEFVGAQTVTIAASTTTNTNITFALTGGLASTPAADDFVIVSFGVGATVNVTFGVNTAGYSEIAELYANDSYDANLSVSWKRMGATPDTVVQVSATGNLANAGAVVIQVWRGVDATTPFSSTATTAVGTNGGGVNPAAITVNAFSDIVVTAGATASVSGGVYTFGAVGAYDLTQQIQNVSATNDVSVGMGVFSYSAVTFPVSVDPTAWTITNNANTMSWAAVTMVLKEAAAPPVGGDIKVQIGGTWVAKPVKVWNGSAWVQKPVKFWNGSAWVLS